MEVKSGVPAEAVNQAAAHVLFVEGSGLNAIDPRALTRLLRDTDIAVRPLGPSFSIKSAAQALHPYHPNYYFVIDRDYHDEASVNDAWTNFPNPATNNLLIWRKRELENYFLDPDYLSGSTFLTRCKPAELKTRLLKLGAERIFFDLANQTIAKLREVQKAKWIEDFTNPANFPTAAKAIDQLKLCTPLTTRAALLAEHLKFEAIEKTFRELEAEYLDGTAKPQFGKGQWLDKMRGKPILAALVNECFVVKDTDENLLTGSEAVSLVAEELLQQDLTRQPADFQELHKLIAARVQMKS